MNAYICVFAAYGLYNNISSTMEVLLLFGACDIIIAALPWLELQNRDISTY